MCSPAPRRSHLPRALAPLLILGLVLPAEARAQSTEPSAQPSVDPHPAAFEVFAGGELEHYLRTLQNVGMADPHPWSLRALSPEDVRRLGVPAEGHPWADRFRFDSPEGKLEYGFVRPRAVSVYNSAFPFGGNDGPMWAGRGLTGAVQAGGYVRWGPVSLVVAPVAFRAQNRAFEMAPAGGGELGAYRNALTPRGIDLPQRFGPDSYARLDAGHTTLRVEGAGLSVGVSTAAQQWGGSQVHPLVLGPNAGGFPHVFVGTERPLDLWIGAVHGRLHWGRLDASAYAPPLPEPEIDTRRFMSGMVVAFQPRGLAGLEVGLIRFAHLEWPDRIGSDQIWKPFETLVGPRAPDVVRVDQPPDNEFASAFARWNAPGAGFEVFAEIVRIDGAHTTRVFVTEPDDLSGYAAGFRRVWEGSGPAGGRLTVLRGEWISTVSSHRQRGGARPQFGEEARPMYQHGWFHQGHTHRGQLLASPAGHGGQGGILGVDRYHPTGRWTIEAERRLERDRTVRASMMEDAPPADVTYALGIEGTRFQGRFELDLGLRGVYNLNRHFDGDAFSLGVRAAVSARF